MIFHKIFRFTNFLIFCIWGLQSCTKDDLIETPADTDSETTENPYGMIRIAEKDLTPDVFKLMLQDDEPATILFNNTQRGFRVNQHHRTARVIYPFLFAPSCQGGDCVGNHQRI